MGRSSLATADDALESVIGVLLQHSELSLRARGAVLLKEMISKQVCNTQRCKLEHADDAFVIVVSIIKSVLQGIEWKYYIKPGCEKARCRLQFEAVVKCYFVIV